jgi:sucrose-6-phosphate hydrolase SacC (GH32 family)
VTPHNNVDFTRRLILTASAALFLPLRSFPEGGDGPVVCWKLDDDGDAAREDISGAEDPVVSRTRHARWIGRGQNRALRLDGYSVWVEHSASHIQLNSGFITVSAWIALESYPVNEAALVQLEFLPDCKCALTIDKWGYVRLRVRRAGQISACCTEEPVPRGRWTHLAGSLESSGLGLYLNGVRHAHADSSTQGIRSQTTTHITLGRLPDSPVIAETFPTGVLNGLLRDVRIFDSGLSRTAVESILNESRPDSAPDLEINGTWCGDDVHRPAYHALPPRAWTNEPHGLVRFGGRYHLFYQKDANGPFWGHINWGHMTSDDLYQWTEMPVALSPEAGPDSEGCWSGSVIEHGGNLAILYTGGDGKRASICMARSHDGVSFSKHPGNPVIAQPPSGHNFPEFRDPFVWREEDTFYMIIGSAIKDVGGAALLYRSKDLINWEYKKPLLVGDRESSGVFWEMPVFFRAGDERVLIVCEVPGRASYWVGSWKDETFSPRDTYPKRLELFNHMLSPTPHILPDGRVIAMGIIPDQRSPKDCWRAGWAHLYSLPRLFSIDSSGHLCQSPYEGIYDWLSPFASVSDLPIPRGAMQPLTKVPSKSLHFRVTIRKGDSRAIVLRLYASGDLQEFTDLRYEWEYGRLTLDRSHSSLSSSVVKDIQQSTHFPSSEGALHVEAFLDASVLEVFLDHKNAFGTRIYPTLDSSTGILLGAEGGSAFLETFAASQIKTAK